MDNIQVSYLIDAYFAVIYALSSLGFDWLAIEQRVRGTCHAEVVIKHAASDCVLLTHEVEVALHHAS